MRRILFVLLVFLSACAPTQVGTGVFAPFTVNENQVGIPGPGIWYVKVRSFMSIPISIRNKAFDGKIGYEDIRVGFSRPESGDWIKVDSIKVPDGWNLELARQEVTRSISDVDESGGSKTYTFSDSLNLVFKVVVPNGVTSGSYPLGAQLGLYASAEKGVAGFLVTLGAKDKSIPQ
jgi:hypothetical protein